MPIDAPIHTNASNLGRVLNAGLPVLLVFWGRNCPPCDQLMPALDHLARAHAGRVLVVKVEGRDEPDLLARYHIEALPTIVFARGGQTLATARGAVGEADLAAWAEYLAGQGAQPPVPSGPSIPLPEYAAASEQAAAHAGSYRPAPRAAGPGAPAGQVTVVTDNNFDQVISTTALPVLVDFWAVWCGPCRLVAPIVEELARAYAGRAVVAKLNVDENPNVAARYGIMSIPTLLIFRDGQIVDRMIGAQPGPVLRRHLAQQLPPSES
jgi:thioredoxin 1